LSDLGGGAALINNPGGAAQVGTFMQNQQATRQNNEILRDQITRRTKQQEAMDKIPGVLSVFGIPEEQKAAYGLLAEANPDAFTQGLMANFLAPPKDKPNDIRVMEYLGLSGAEGFAEYQKMKRTTDPEIQRLLFEANEAIFDYQQKLGVAGREDVDRVRQDKRDRLKLFRGGQDVMRATELINSLEGTELETGRGGLAGISRRTGYAFYEAAKNVVLGDRTDDEKRVIAEFDELEKLLTSIVNDQATDANSAQTDRYRSSLAAGSAGTNMSSGANRRVLSSLAQDYLDEANIIGYDLPNKAELQAFVGDIKGYPQDQAAQPAQSATPSPGGPFTRTPPSQTPGAAQARQTPTAPPAATDGQSTNKLNMLFSAMKEGGASLTQMQQQLSKENITVADVGNMDLRAITQAEVDAIIAYSETRKRSLGAEGKAAWEKQVARLKKARNALPEREKFELPTGVTVDWLDE
tara:strand:- start:1699 stop:3096 length:1398 start_codon:yes stop_codon:yes gene_type:complete